MRLRHLAPLLLPLLLAVGLGPGLASAAAPPEDAPARSIDVVLARYEAIRQLLIADSAKGAAGHAEVIVRELESLSRSFDARAAGVRPEEAEEAEGLLPLLLARARRLAAASGLAATREAYYELSKPLVRYREHLAGGRPIVAYCSMAEKSWLQPDEALGNPYYGTSMLRCGRVVSK